MTDTFARRSVLVGTGAAGIAALTGCQVYGTPTGGEEPQPPAGAGDQPLAQAADIPVGGGAVFGDRGVVVTQPEAGTFKAFSATCTHQGCTVAEVSNGTINCGCHGSAFRIADGSVANGPAKKALTAREIVVSDGGIRLA